MIPSLKLDTPRMMDSTGALDSERCARHPAGGRRRLHRPGAGHGVCRAGLESFRGGDAAGPAARAPTATWFCRCTSGWRKSSTAILLNTTVAAVKEEANGIRVTFDGPKSRRREKVFDKVLVSVGRKPNSEIAGLDKTQVKVGPRGFIQVNKQLQTDDPAIYAIGDVVGEPMLAHKASHEGRTAVEAIAGHKVAFEPNAIPAVVFTDPEIAWCGLTETQAKKENREIKVAKFPWAASGRAMTLDRTEGMTKLIIDPQTERVLGVGIVGAGAGRADRRRRAGDRDGRAGQRHRADHPSASHAFGNGDGGGRSLLRHQHRHLPAEGTVGAAAGEKFTGFQVRPQRQAPCDSSDLFAMPRCA